MSTSITLPLWLVGLIALLAARATLDRLLVPSVRWFLRRRMERVIDELNKRLQLEIPAFNRARRRVLIDRLLSDPAIAEAVGEVPRGDRDYAVSVGLRMLTLRHLVREEEGLFQVVPSEAPLLHYYANAIAHLLDGEAARDVAI